MTLSKSFQQISDLPAPSVDHEKLRRVRRRVMRREKNIVTWRMMVREAQQTLWREDNSRGSCSDQVAVLFDSLV